MKREELFEQYTLSESKDEFISKLIPDTYDAMYFQSLHILNTKTTLSEQDLKVINLFLEKFYFQKLEGQQLHSLEFLRLLRVFDSKESTDQQRTEALASIKKYFRISFNANKTTGSLPTAVAYGTEINSSEVEFSAEKSLLDQNLFNLNKIVEDSYSNLHKLQQINTDFLMHIDVEKMLKQPKTQGYQFHQMLEYFLGNVPCLHQVKKVPEIYQALYDDYKSRKSIYDFNLAGYDRLSITQLNELGVLMRSVVFDTFEFQYALMRKLFLKKIQKFAGKDHSFMTAEEKTDKMGLLEEILAWVKANLPSRHQILARKIVQEIVLLNESENVYEVSYFTQFLASPPTSNPISLKKVRDVITSEMTNYSTNWNQLFEFSQLPNPKNFIENYLLVLFKKAENVKPFDEYLDEKFLQKTFLKAKILSGQQEYIAQSTNVFLKNEMESMLESRSITILEKNDRYIRGNEEVTLSVDVKNIQHLIVNVFEIKTEDYYLQKNAALDNQINLDGLIPLHRTEYSYANPANEVVRRSFTFESISSAQRGYFIIDFFGNSISSRAVYQKGALSFVDTQTIAGHLICIIDENKTICKPTVEGKRTGLWFGGQFHSANKDGHILMPYRNSQETKQAILVHEDFSEMQQLTILSEVYQFNCAYVYQQESFLPGSKAKVLIRPVLSLNGQRASLNLIEEQQIKVNLQNHQNIPTSIEFKDLKFSAEKDTEIEIPIQSVLSHVSIECNGTVTKLDGSKQNISNSKRIEFDLHNNPQNQLFNLYLKDTKDLGYTICALDKSGQAQQHVPIQVVITDRRIRTPVNQSLETDADGKVVLGPLTYSVSVVAVIHNYQNNPSIVAEWKLSEHKSLELPQSIIKIEGSNIELPISEGVALSREAYSFHSVGTHHGSQFVYEDLFDSLKADGAFVQLEGLPAGSYVLKYLDSCTSINIEIVAGKYWKHNSAYIVSGDRIINTGSKSQAILSIQSAEIQKGDAESTEILVKLNLPKSLSAALRTKLKVHVLGYNFHSNRSETNIQDLKQIEPRKQVTQPESRQTPANFFNNKKIGDEICYVLNRQNEQRRIGNTLEKPCMLIKRTKNRDTTFDEEKLEQTKGYADESVKRSMKHDRMFAGAASSRSGMAYGGGGGSHLSNGEIDTFLNFLKSPCFLSSNNSVSEDGTVRIALDKDEWKNYPNIQVIVSSEEISLLKSFPLLNSAPTETQDLRHQSAMKSDQVRKNMFIYYYFGGKNCFNYYLLDWSLYLKCCSQHVFVSEQKQLYTENFRSGKLLQGQSLLASADSTTAVIGSLPELFQIQKVLMKTGRKSDEYLGKAYNTWSFLKDWAGLTDRQKLDKYNEFASHELNIFVYFKDSKFFDRVVLPFLQNKIQKSFVDEFLLDNQAAVHKFARTERLAELNVLEQALLILSLVKHGQKARAEELAASIETKQKSQPKNLELQKRLFLTIIESSAKDEVVAELKRAEKALRSRGPPPPPMMAMASMEMAPMMAMAMPRSSLIQSAAPMAKMALRSNAKMQEQCMDLMMDEDCDDGGMALEEASLMEARKDFKQGYKKLDKTVEYIERQYFNDNQNSQYSNLVFVNAFWADLVRHIVSTGGVSNFASENFIYAFNNHVEAIAVLALLDLSFSTRDNFDLSAQPARKIQVLAKNNVMYFSKEIVQSSSITKANIGIIQSFCDPEDMYTVMKDDPSIEIEKEVEEFLVNKIYVCKIIVTNISIANLNLSVLSELPEGAIPVNSFEYTKSNDFVVNSYQTYNEISFSFYFPKAGEFSIYRSSASRNGVIIAQANEIPKIVVKTVATIKKMENLSDILNNGSKEDILSFLKTINLSDPTIFNAAKVLHIVQADKVFFQALLEIMREKGVFNLQVWEYSLFHNDERGVLELLNNHSFRKSRMTSNFHSLPNLETDQLSINSFAVFEYHPLLTSRVHSFMDQNKSKILNVQFKQTYFEYVNFLAHVPQPNVSQLLVLAYYLILQERIDEALNVFARIQAPQLTQTAKIQYDYFAAYLDIYTGGPNFKRAREISEAYLDYPIISWRNLFVNLSNQLAEYDGQEAEESELIPNADLSKNIVNAEKEPSLSMEIAGSTVVVFHQNMKSAELNFYQLDVEVLFSTQPFPSGSNRNNFSFIKPNESIHLTFEKASNMEKVVVNVPEALAKKNLHVQLVSEQGIENLSYFSSSLKVQTIEKFGQVKVTNEAFAPLSKVYVKCFAKHTDDSVQFFRDGYTDLRGRFDYALSSSGDISKVKQFAILVVSDELGSVIREAKPPTEAGKIDVTVSLLKKK